MFRISWANNESKSRLGYIFKVSKNLKLIINLGRRLTRRQTGQQHVRRVGWYCNVGPPGPPPEQAQQPPNRTCRVATGQLLAMPIPTPLFGGPARSTSVCTSPPGTRRSRVYHKAMPSPWRFFFPVPWTLKWTCISQSLRKHGWKRNRKAPQRYQGSGASWGGPGMLHSTGSLRTPPKPGIHSGTGTRQQSLKCYWPLNEAGKPNGASRLSEAQSLPTRAFKQAFLSI